jgi:hypothetical protein
MKEVWKTVPSAPHFLVSDEGRIMVSPHYKEMPYGGMRRYGGHPYLGVWNKADGRFIIVHKGRTYKVAPLVCEAFNGGKVDPTHVCMHIDEDARNNRPANLAWGTQKENLNAPKYIARLKNRPDSAICKCCKETFSPRYSKQMFCSCHCSGHFNNKTRAGLSAEWRR